MPASTMAANKETKPSSHIENQHSILPRQPSPLRVIIMVASIAAGIQFGWAIQLSLLTPYVQLLGIPHSWAPFIWLCGPISGMLVQPIVGFHSDRCTSRFGRRRPFIAAGAGLVGVAVFLIGFAADIGHRAGDPADKTPKVRAIAVFVVGFWILDVANNMLQGPCRALLADLAAEDQKKTRTANAFFSFFMAVGNVLGYAAGSYTHLYKIFPFSKTKACNVFCANLKSCFFLSIALLITLTSIALSLVNDEPHTEPEPTGSDGDKKKGYKLPFFSEIFGALKDLKKPMWVLLLVTCLNWIAWFPFLILDTDWMGREVYGGKAGDKAFAKGVRAGSLGLVLYSVVLGFVSLSVEKMARWLGSVKRLWGIVNFLLAICLALTVLITKLAESARRYPGGGHTGTGEPLTPPVGVVAGALTIFAVLGIPQAITFSIPFALASIFSNDSGAGQGLSLGVLNLAIVVPQMFVSLTSGKWNDLFGGGNLPSFVVGAIAAAISGIFALTMLPSPPPELLQTTKNVGHI